MDSFDFDAWAALAKSRPDEFERRRREVLGKLIENSGATEKLHGLQCNIDLERIRARTPLKCSVNLAELLLRSLLDLEQQMKR